MGIIKVGQINIDGTKIKGNSANRLTKSKEEYQEWLKKIRVRIEEILNKAAEVDLEEDKTYGDKRGDELPEELRNEIKLKEKIEEAIKKIKDEEEKINLTDKDAKFMRGGDGKIEASYNCQIASNEEQIIISNEIIAESNDCGALKPMVEKTEEILQEKIEEVAADRGYGNYKNYEYLVGKKITGYVPPIQR